MLAWLQIALVLTYKELLLQKISTFHRYIQGAPLFGNSNGPSYDPMLVGEELNKIKLPAKYSNDKSLSSAPSLHARFVGQSYKQVYGILLISR